MTGSLDSGGLRAFQSGFAASLRDPGNTPLPTGVSVRGMQAYQELVFNNLQGFLDAGFPISRALLGADWGPLVRRFFREYHCRSPLFREIAGEFLDWCAQQSTGEIADRPFLLEFMHYEWLELVVEVAPDEAEDVDPDGDLLDGRPHWQTAARLACYRFPVHSIGPGFQPERDEGAFHCYLLWRDDEDRVRFLLLALLAARLGELLQGGRVSGREALRLIAAETGQEPEVLLSAGRQALEVFRRLGVVSGTRRLS